jgi:hypothetical protein
MIILCLAQYKKQMNFAAKSVETENKENDEEEEATVCT